MIWLIEMKYLTSLTEINYMLCFDFDYLFDRIYEDEKERQKKEQANGE